MNVGPTWGVIIPSGGCGVSSRMLAPPSFQIVSVGCRRGGTHLAGAEGEVDFGEFYATRRRGELVKCWMFVMRLSHSGRAFHVAFGTQAQEAFLEGHVLAFEHFGGVPGRVRYDNLKPAVVRVLRGRDRTESERFTALRSHYGFDSFFCRPGIEGAHEKGGVEGEIGRFRRRHLVPVPKVDSLAELNELIAAGDVVDDDRVITGRPVTIGAAFAAEAPSADGAARSRRSTRPGCWKHAWTTGPGCRCGSASTPSRPATPDDDYRCGWPLARSRSSTGQRWSPVTSGPSGSYVEVLTLDHYLEVLKVKPGGLARRDRARPGGRHLARSPPRISRTGTPPAKPAVTRPEPGAGRGPARAPHPARHALIAAMERAVTAAVSTQRSC